MTSMDQPSVRQWKTSIQIQVMILHAQKALHTFLGYISPSLFRPLLLLAHPLNAQVGDQE